METLSLIDMTILIIAGITWITVAILVTDNFNEFTGNVTWYEIPRWVRVPIVVIAPIIFIWWSNEIWSKEPPPKFTD